MKKLNGKIKECEIVIYVDEETGDVTRRIQRAMRTVGARMQMTDMGARYQTIATPSRLTVEAEQAEQAEQELGGLG